MEMFCANPFVLSSHCLEHYLFICLPRILPAHIIHYAHVLWCNFLRHCLILVVGKRHKWTKNTHRNVNLSELSVCAVHFSFPLFWLRFDKISLFTCMFSWQTTKNSKEPHSRMSCWTRWWPKRRRAVYRVNKQYTSLIVCYVHMFVVCCFCLLCRSHTGLMFFAHF